MPGCSPDGCCFGAARNPKPICVPLHPIPPKPCICRTHGPADLRKLLLEVRLEETSGAPFLYCRPLSSFRKRVPTTNASSVVWTLQEQACWEARTKARHGRSGQQGEGATWEEAQRTREERAC